MNFVQIEPSGNPATVATQFAFVPGTMNTAANTTLEYDPTNGGTTTPSSAPGYAMVSGTAKSPSDDDRTLTCKVTAYDEDKVTEYGSTCLTLYAQASGTHYAFPSAVISLRDAAGNALPAGTKLFFTISSETNAILEGNDYWSITVAELDPSHIRDAGSA